MAQSQYLITEPYDGYHVRVISSGRTPYTATQKYHRLARMRAAKGQSFFSPIRHVIGVRAEVHQAPDREIATLPTWTA